jgi:5-oxoprolinase (ATP-hydrolysing)
MQQAVKYQIENHPNISEGDVLVSNHPNAGGSHAPDITVISPVFHNHKIIFFMASRGHHADIGGISPGSMPPFSKELWEEGAVTKSFKLVKSGVFQEAGITEILQAPQKYPGCSGTRNLRDNLADLKAQIAANHRGIQLCHQLIAEHGLQVVHAYMEVLYQAMIFRFPSRLFYFGTLISVSDSRFKRIANLSCCDIL